MTGAANCNQRYFASTTLRFGSNAGVGIALLYFAELLLLLANPVDVMSPTESRYLAYSIFAERLDANEALREWSQEARYDFVCWILDRDKIPFYALMVFWFGMLAAIARESARTQRRSDESFSRTEPLRYDMESSAMRRQLERMARPRNSWWPLPFWLNVVLAAVLTSQLGGVAVRPTLDDEMSTSIVKLATGSPLSCNPFFITYRLFYPLVMFGCLLNFTIGIQVIWGSPAASPSADGPRPISLLLQFLLFAAIIQYSIFRDKFGSGDFEVYDVSRAGVPAAIAIAVAILALYKEARGSKAKAPTADILQGFGRLPAYAQLALLLMAMPLLVHVTSLLVPEAATGWQKLAPYTQYLADFSNSSPETKLTRAWIRENNERQRQFAETHQIDTRRHLILQTEELSKTLRQDTAKLIESLIQQHGPLADGEIFAAASEMARGRPPRLRENEAVLRYVLDLMRKDFDMCEIEGTRRYRLTNRPDRIELKSRHVPGRSQDFECPTRRDNEM